MIHDTPELFTKLQAKEHRIAELEQQLAISRNKVTVLKWACDFIGQQLSQPATRSQKNTDPTAK